MEKKKKKEDSTENKQAQRLAVAAQGQSRLILVGDQGAGKVGALTSNFFKFF